MREKYFKRTITVLLAVMVALVFSVGSTVEVSAASGTIKMKTYYSVIKSGNYAYCLTSGGIYKVNAKSGKVVRLVKLDPERSMERIKKKGNYIYYILNDENTSYLYRVKTTGGKARKLFSGGTATGIISYAISGKKLYVTYFRINSYNNSSNYHKVMKLNGKSKKKTGMIAKDIQKWSNKKGWRVKEKYKGKYIYSFLKTPNKTILICKTKDLFQ